LFCPKPGSATVAHTHSYSRNIGNGSEEHGTSFYKIMIQRGYSYFVCSNQRWNTFLVRRKRCSRNVVSEWGRCSKLSHVNTCLGNGFVGFLSHVNICLLVF
jgi:hypothetical protein